MKLNHSKHSKKESRCLKLEKEFKPDSSDVGSFNVQRTAITIISREDEYAFELLTFYHIVLWPVNSGVDIISFNVVKFNERWWDWICLWIIDSCDLFDANDVTI